MTTLVDIQRHVGVAADGKWGDATAAAVGKALGLKSAEPINPDMRLSDNFTLREFVRSQTAERRGIPNLPPAEHLRAMQLLCAKVLEPVRAHFGRPVRITSGYRSAELNRAIGGSPTSQHSKGEAADFEIPGIENRRVAKWIAANLPFDQLILEGHSAHDPNAGWIHVSYSSSRARKEVLTATFPGPVYSKGIG